MSVDWMLKQSTEQKLKAKLVCKAARMIERRIYIQVSLPLLLFLLHYAYIHEHTIHNRFNIKWHFPTPSPSNSLTFQSIIWLPLVFSLFWQTALGILQANITRESKYLDFWKSCCGTTPRTCRVIACNFSEPFCSMFSSTSDAPLFQIYLCFFQFSISIYVVPVSFQVHSDEKYIC